MSEPIDIGCGYGAKQHAIVDRLRTALVGRTVVDIVDKLPTEDPGWSDHGSIALVFDDGAQLDCGGWGHDAWGPSIYYEPAPARKP